MSFIGTLRRPIEHPTSAGATTRSAYPPRPGENRGPAPVPPLLARIIGGVGRSLVGIGVLLLLFAGFQLWGTGIAEARAQEALTSRFQAELDAGDRPDAQPPTGESPSARTAPTIDAGLVELMGALRYRQPAVSPGDPVARLHIPAIGVSKTVVEGTSREALRSGPGHYRSTPLPGRPGNVAIAGHRTTNGAPFFDIDLLQPGDEINVETGDGSFTYVVEGHDNGSGLEVGHVIVEPKDVEVIADQGDDRLTLTACYPKYSAKQRIIVTATLRPDDPVTVPTVASAELPTAEENPAPPTATPARDQVPPTLARWTPPSDSNAAVAESLGWQRGYAGPTMAWATFTTLIGLAGWLSGRLWRRWPAYAMTVPPLALALFHCFANLERFLPAV